MFTSTGLFKDVPCPKRDECTLINCIFSHDQIEPEIAAKHFTEIRTVTASTNEALAERLAAQPARKRKRIEPSGDTSEDEGEVKEHNERGEKLTAPLAANGSPKSASVISKDRSQLQPTPKSILKSTEKPVSPPPIRSAKPLIPGPSQIPAPKQTGPPAPSKTLSKETLTPRMLQRSPASYTVRLQIVNQLHAAMIALNEKAGKELETEMPFVLSPDELITMALDEEETTATKKFSIYANVIKSFIMQLKKMSLPDWRKLVAETFQKKFAPSAAVEKLKMEKVITTGLTTEQEILVLQKMQTPLEGLERHGYVTNPPTEKEIETAKKGVEAAGGYEKCERCGMRFQVFPGRREEDGALASGGSCTYHWGKVIRPPRQKTDHITGQQEAYYPCCMETVGKSSGCTTIPHHVFKVSEAKRLASIWQFERTPETNTKESDEHHELKPPVAFDAEMGYTTKGLELIRLTAVAWPTGFPLLDVLVRPLGEILDLNTRFSGITLVQMANASAYNPSDTISATTIDNLNPSSRPLAIVPNPQTARSLLFQHLTSQTPLIGHAIENDLNATRIIHPFIVDTVLLYPHPKGLPIRYGLKMLASKHLERNIQRTNMGTSAGNGTETGSAVGSEGGIKGHDSKEDAIATGDLVRVQVREKWKEMKREGWRFERVDSNQHDAKGTENGNTNEEENKSKPTAVCHGWRLVEPHTQFGIIPRGQKGLELLRKRKIGDLEGGDGVE